MANSEGFTLDHRGGFTLLETIIAIAIMVLAFASILAVESGSINSSARARQMNIVAMLAKNQMTETEYQIEGKSFDEIKKEDGGAFPPPYQDYRWEMKIKEVEFPNISAQSGNNPSSGSSTGGSGDNSGNTDISELISKLVTQYLSKAIREVTVTIFWKKGGGEQKFSVTTYWVDLNHEFQLSQ